MQKDQYKRNHRNMFRAIFALEHFQLPSTFSCLNETYFQPNFVCYYLNLNRNLTYMLFCLVSTVIRCNKISCVTCFSCPSNPHPQTNIFISLFPFPPSFCFHLFFSFPFLKRRFNFSKLDLEPDWSALSTSCIMFTVHGKIKEASQKPL